MEHIQFIQVSADQYRKEIVSDIKEQINQLRSEFQPKTPTEYLTRREVSDLLKIDLSTVHNWTKSGKLTAYGIGHRIYFKRSEIELALIPIND